MRALPHFPFTILLLLSLAGASLAIPDSPPAPALPECAVLDFAAAAPDSLAALSVAEALRAELFRAGAVRLVARHQMEAILQEQGFQQSGCSGGECTVRTGQVLGVSQLVTGSLARRSAGGWEVRAERIDVESGAVLGMAEWSTLGGWEQFGDSGAAQVARGLWGETIPPQPIRSPTVWPLALGIVYPLQIPFKSVAIHGLAIDALFGRHAEVAGLAVGAAGVIEGRMVGLQVQPLYAEADELWGLQAGLANHARVVRGLQVGLVNTCERLQGVQVGLVNRVTSRAYFGSWLPLVNAGF